MYLAGVYVLTLILSNIELSECPPTVVHGFFQSRSYEILTMNALLASGVYYIYEKLFGVKRAILHNSIFALFILIVSESLRIVGYAKCLHSANVHMLALALIHHFMSIRLKKMYLFGFMVPIWMVPSFIYLVALCFIWRREHFILAAFVGVFQKLFRRAHQRYYQNKYLLPKHKAKPQQSPAQAQQHTNISQNYDFDSDKLNINTSDVSQYRLKQLLQMGYPVEQAVLALNATGLDDHGKSISSQESVQKAVELIQNGQVNATDNVKVVAAQEPQAT